MGRRRTYLISGAILILLGITIAAYPILDYYFTDYLRSPHSVLTKGSNFVYAGTLLVPNGSILLVFYNITYAGNGKFRVNVSSYSIPNKLGMNLKIQDFPSLTYNEDKIVTLTYNGTGVKLSSLKKKTMLIVVNKTDPLIETFFPEGSVSVVSYGKSREFNLVVRKLPFSSDFSPSTVGFPWVYTVNLPRALWKYLLPVNYYRGNDRYLARNLEVVGAYFKASTQEVPANATLELDGLPVGSFIGINASNVDLPTFFPDLNWSYMNCEYPSIIGLSLVYTNIQPAYQDWWGEFKYSFVQYSAPVDYILILLGIVFLILAGRAGK